MDYSVTDSAGRRVAVKAHNWLFAIASGLRALEVDAATLTSLTCAYEPDGSILVNGTGDRRWWVKSLAPSLPFSSGDQPTPFESNLPFNSAPPFSVPKAPPAPPAPAAPPVAKAPEPAASTPPTQPRIEAPPEALRPVDGPQAYDALNDEDSMMTVRQAPGLPPAVPPLAPSPPVVDAPESHPTLEPEPETAPPKVAKPPKGSRPLGRPRVVADEQDIKVVVSTRSERLQDDDALFVDDPDDRTPVNIVADLSVPAPVLHMPTSSLIRDEPESLAERLFEASMDFMGAEPAEACQIALDLVNEFVYAEASSIAIGTLNDRELTFVAATGPVRDQILGQSLPFGKGLVGMCFDMRATMSFEDVSQNEHHHSALDEATGFRTVAAMCVPILDDSGLVLGVIQLLNSSERKFYSDDEEAVENVARALAGALAF